jgi:hypothetical protein
MSFPQGNRANPAGRSKGSRNRLSGAFLTALADDFEQHGIEAIRITRIESPDIYCRLVASLMPREFTLEDNRLGELSDDELDAVIAYTRHRLTNQRELAIEFGARTIEAVNSEQTSVLQAVS